ncbi:hypothetical protein HDU86_005106 [Geranomyces michiganensis]|nr:hypothetical protein HDU86_005106 [Geranomyces michiganensis]
MGDAGFFKGTSAEQDQRFGDKQKKLLKSMKFPKIFDSKVDMKKVNMTVIRPWVTAKIVEMVGFEDDVLIEFVFNLLEADKVDPRAMQIEISGFLESNAPAFMKDLWGLLVSAQTTIGGIPQLFLDQKKAEIIKKRTEDEEVRVKLEAQRAKEAAERAERDAARKKDMPVSSSVKPERNRSNRSRSRTRSRSPSRTIDRSYRSHVDSRYNGGDDRAYYDRDRSSAWRYDNSRRDDYYRSSTGHGRLQVRPVILATMAEAGSGPTTEEILLLAASVLAVLRRLLVQLALTQATRDPTLGRQYLIRARDPTVIQTQIRADPGPRRDVTAKLAMASARKPRNLCLLPGGLQQHPV